MDAFAQVLSQGLTDQVVEPALPSQNVVDLFEEQFQKVEPTPTGNESVIGDFADKIGQNLEGLHNGFREVHEFLKRHKPNEDGSLPTRERENAYVFSEEGPVIRGPASSDLTSTPELKDPISVAKRLANESRQMVNEFSSFNLHVSEMSIKTTLTSNVASKSNKNLDMLLRGQ